MTGGPSSTPRTWYLLGKQLNPKCLVALMGIGNHRLHRILQCRLDNRRSFGKATWVMCFCATYFVANSGNSLFSRNQAPNFLFDVAKKKLSLPANGEGASIIGKHGVVGG